MVRHRRPVAFTKYLLALYVILVTSGLVFIFGLSYLDEKTSIGSEPKVLRVGGEGRKNESRDEHGNGSGGRGEGILGGRKRIETQRHKSDSQPHNRTPYDVITKPLPRTEVPIAEANTMKNIMYMEGWLHNEDFYASDFSFFLDFYSSDSCGYLCRTSKIGEVQFSSANLVVFQPSSLHLIPPRKKPDQYWMLLAFEDLTDKDLHHIEKRKYNRLLDFYMIIPLNSLTPLKFLKRVNSLPKNDEGDDEADWIYYSDKRLSFSVTQILATGVNCKTPDSTSVNKTLIHSLGYQLHALSPRSKFQHLLSCFSDSSNTYELEMDVLFYVLDVDTCFSGILNQLLKVLRDGYGAVPIIPRLTGGHSIQTLSTYAPPTSFISYSDFTDVNSLHGYLKNLVSNRKSYLKYQEWRTKYKLNTETATDPHKSAVCRLCQIAHEAPFISPDREIPTLC